MRPLFLLGCLFLSVSADQPRSPIGNKPRSIWQLKPIPPRESRLDEEVGAFARGLDILEPRQTSTCQNPAVRKEWRELTPGERNDYLTAVKCLYTSPTKGIYPDKPFVKTRMDDIAWTHSIVQEQVHLVWTFLPFHRWFIQFYEDVLRNECNYTGYSSYWDWTIDADANNVPNAPVWSPDAFGGNGRFTRNDTKGFQYCVPDGRFAYPDVTLTLGGTWPDYEDDQNVNVPHCLSRTFNDGSGKKDEQGNYIVGDMLAKDFYSSEAMNITYSKKTYYVFEETLEYGAHAGIHLSVSGDMRLAVAPHDGIFFAHHNNIDRAWAKWQSMSPGRLVEYSGWKDRKETIPVSLDDQLPVGNLLNGGEPPVVRDYMNTKGGKLCYEYST
ncbi:monooxygenase [Moniliophthora roreri MCA 2997]|uniref:Monooxygenase n=2 Tax=Moniliophthora roreri TaxID=221103 RepID=V2XRY6_MONRO|nr:monooxygenase [Moniliophthora roreri MCA 2997]